MRRFVWIATVLLLGCPSIGQRTSVIVRDQTPDPGEHDIEVDSVGPIANGSTLRLLLTPDGGGALSGLRASSTRPETLSVESVRGDYVVLRARAPGRAGISVDAVVNEVVLQLEVVEVAEVEVSVFTLGSDTWAVPVLTGDDSLASPGGIAVVTGESVEFALHRRGADGRILTGSFTGEAFSAIPDTALVEPTDRGSYRFYAPSEPGEVTVTVGEVAFVFDVVASEAAAGVGVGGAYGQGRLGDLVEVLYEQRERVTLGLFEFTEDGRYLPDFQSSTPLTVEIIEADVEVLPCGTLRWELRLDSERVPEVEEAFGLTCQSIDEAGDVHLALTRGEEHAEIIIRVLPEVVDDDPEQDAPEQDAPEQEGLDSH